MYIEHNINVYIHIILIIHHIGRYVTYLCSTDHFFARQTGISWIWLIYKYKNVLPYTYSAISVFILVLIK
jgi:hypothetical protein